MSVGAPCCKPSGWGRALMRPGPPPGCGVPTGAGVTPARDAPPGCWLGNCRPRSHVAPGAPTLLPTPPPPCPPLASLQAAADVLAMASLEVDLSGIEEGQTVTVKWRGKPVFIRHRQARRGVGHARGGACEHPLRAPEWPPSPQSSARPLLSPPAGLPRRSLRRPALPWTACATPRPMQVRCCFLGGGGSRGARSAILCARFRHGGMQGGSFS